MLDGIHLVEAAPATRIRWVGPDGSTGELPIGYESVLGDDPLRLDGGVATAHGMDVDWDLWFTREASACVAFTPRSFEGVYPVCLGPHDDADIAQLSASVALPDARWCDTSPGGVVAGLGWADPGTDAEIRYGDRVGEVRIHELPDGRTVALGFVVYDFPPEAEAYLAVTDEGREQRWWLGLPGPSGPIATYPDGCPDLTTPTTLPGSPTTSPPRPAYPSL